jgi:hypothetical protein
MGYDGYEEATAYLDIDNIGSLYKLTCRFTSKLMDNILPYVILISTLSTFPPGWLPLHLTYLTSTYSCIYSFLYYLDLQVPGLSHHSTC